MGEFDQIQLYRYRIPCQTGMVLRKQPLVERQGLIIQLKKAGKIGLGEIAPLPNFSVETLKMAEKQCRKWCVHPQLKGTDLDKYSPSVAFGISCALAEIEGRLQAEGQYQSAILCDGNMDAFQQKLAQTSSTLGKIKIGFNAKQEGQFANRLLTQFPQLTLRLDANRAWQLAQAVEFAKQIAKPFYARIQFIEEPCQTPVLSRAFSEKTGIAIAWDETVREPDFSIATEKQSTKNLSAIVIKPTLVGSLEKCKQLIQHAHQQGLQAVISSSIESSLGLTQLARIAKQYSPSSIAGLDTLNLMQYQLIRAWQGSTLPLVDLESDFVERIY